MPRETASDIPSLDRSALYRKWRLEMRRLKLFHPGERVGVAISGGGDSVLLFHFLRQFALETGLALSLLHFNHRLRGAESESDEAFVRKLAESKGVPFFRQEADVAILANVSHGNVEATGRDLRYRFFLSLVEKDIIDKAATAHSASDQAETVLLRLMRGTGSRGLAGIQRVRNKMILRPFLSLTRQEIRAELAARGFDFCSDSSNLDVRRARNRVRLELLPWIEREFNPGIVEVLADFADRAQADEAWLEEQTRDLVAPYRTRHDRSDLWGPRECIPCSALRSLPIALERRALRQIIADVTDGASISYRHIERIRSFAQESPSGRQLELPGVRVGHEFGVLTFLRRTEGASLPRASSGYCHKVGPPCEIALPKLGIVLGFKIVDCGQRVSGYNIREESSAKKPAVGRQTSAADPLADPQKFSRELILRNWQRGDRVRIPGTQRPLKVKELFRRLRVPALERPSWPVLEIGGEIVWVRGLTPIGGVLEAPGIAIEERPISSAAPTTHHT